MFLILSGLFPLLGLLGTPPDTTLLIYTSFVLLLWLRPFIVPWIRHIPWPPAVKFIMLGVLSGLLTETLAWIGEFLAHNPEPALLHPQLIPDLILAVGMYAGWTAAWAVITRFYRVSVTAVFLTTGFFGVVVEQDGAMLQASLQIMVDDPLEGLFWLIYVFLVYGSFMGIAYLLVEGEFPQPITRLHWLRYPLALGLMALLGPIVFSLTALAADAFSLIPEPRLIWEHPFF